MATDSDAGHAYSPSRWSHRFKDENQVIESHVRTVSKATQAAKANIPCLLNWAVDTTTSLPDHSIDIYYPSDAQSALPIVDSIRPKAIFVYIHGGYWQFLSRNENAFMAQTMSDAQILTTVVGYPIAPRATMEQIVLCVEQALVKILRWARRLSTKVYICGHSAGAHLAATLLLVDWQTKHGIDAKTFAGFFLVSGVYDLVPLVPTYINEPLGMTISAAEHLSPLHRAGEEYWSALKHVPIVCVHAQYDPPTFREQNRQYGAYLEKTGFDQVTTIQLDGVDHFDVIEQLTRPEQPLTAMIFSAMGISLPSA